MSKTINIWVEPVSVKKERLSIALKKELPDIRINIWEGEKEHWQLDGMDHDLESDQLDEIYRIENVMKKVGYQ